MATLKFGKANSLVGFSSLKTARFNNLPPARIVRELVQNSLDAAKEAGVAPAIVRFGVRKANRSDIPDFQGHSRAVQKAVEHHKKESGGKLPEPAQEAVNRISGGLDAVRRGKASLLSVTDNGIGLDAKRMQSLLGDGASTKPDPLTGAYGVGHLAPVALSDIRYMLYGGITKGGKSHGVRVDHNRFSPGEKPPPGRRGIPDKEIQERAPRRAVRVPCPKAYIPEPSQGTWTKSPRNGVTDLSVMALAFNEFRSGGVPLWEVVSKIVSYNFCPAVYHGDLIVEVVDKNRKRQLNKESLIQVLEGEQARVRVARSDSFFRELRPSGTNAFSIP